MTIESETNVTQAVPFFWVQDMEKSIRFYVDGLGFQMKQHWSPDGKLRWCWIELGSAAIMLQEYLEEGKDAYRPQGKVGEGLTISFQCKDALKIYHTLKSRGIPASKPFVGNGMWVFSLSDPDGYRLEFESLTDLPEETQYTED